MSLNVFKVKKNGIIWAIESLIVLLLAVVIACFVSDSRRRHDRTPIQSMRLIEELGLYFGVREVRLNGYDGVGVWRTVFSSSQEKLLDPVSCSFMCNTEYNDGGSQGPHYNAGEGSGSDLKQHHYYSYD